MKNITNIEKQVIKGKKALGCLPKTDGNLDLEGVFKAIEFNTREFQKDLHGHKYKFKCTRNDVPIYSFDYWSDHELSTNEIGEVLNFAAEFPHPQISEVIVTHSIRKKFKITSKPNGERYKIVREAIEKPQLPDPSPKPINFKSVNKNSH
jgi:hypothetical protein